MKQTEVANLELLVRLRAGDESARDKLILDNKGLVHYYVNKFPGRWLAAGGPDPCPPADELEAIGLLALCKAAQSIKLDHPHPSRHLAKWISKELMKGALKEHWTKGVPRGHCAVRLDVSRAKWRPGQDGIIGAAQPKRDEATLQHDLRDLVMTLCTPLERKIVRLLEDDKDLKLRDIAVAVERSPSIVHRHIKRIRKIIADAASAEG
ncbi:MAG: hypothetical protein ABSF26_30180, partial [Thermoguttaceae bacterium]|jgi:hypothetical protein